MLQLIITLMFDTFNFHQIDINFVINYCHFI